MKRNELIHYTDFLFCWYSVLPLYNKNAQVSVKDTQETGNSGCLLMVWLQHTYIHTHTYSHTCTAYMCYASIAYWEYVFHLFFRIPEFFLVITYLVRWSKVNSQGNLTQRKTLLHSFSWRRQWHPTPVLLPGKSHGRRSLVGCSQWGP